MSEKTDLITQLGMNDFTKIKELEDSSAVTIEGCIVDEEGVNDIIDFFKEALKKPDPVIYCAKGDVMNEYCGGLKGSAAYQKDLNIIMIKLDNFKYDELMKLRLEYFGLFRWLDDVCSNNRRRK